MTENNNSTYEGYTFSFTDKNNKVSRSHYSNCINLTDKKTIKFKITLCSDTSTFTNVLVSIIDYVASSNDIVDEEPCVDSVALLPVASSNNIAGVGPCAGSVGPSELSLLESPPLAFLDNVPHQQYH
jgi:hypothetical protein